MGRQATMKTWEHRSLTPGRWVKPVLPKDVSGDVRSALNSRPNSGCPATSVWCQFRTCGPKQPHATFYLLVEDFDRADAEGSVRTLRISTACLVRSLVRQANGFALFNSAAPLLSSPQRAPAGTVSSCRTRMREKPQFNLPVHPLAHTIHSYAKFRGTLDATIRTRPEDTR
jgi:hypothetical protein